MNFSLPATYGRECVQFTFALCAYCLFRSLVASLSVVLPGIGPFAGGNTVTLFGNNLGSGMCSGGGYIIVRASALMDLCVCAVRLL